MKLQYALVAAASALSLSAQTPFQVGSLTNITITGFVGAGIKQADIGDTARKGLSSELRVDDNTSRIFFAGNTKIADGYAVVWQVGSRFTLDVRPGDKVLSNTTVSNTLTVSQASGWADDDSWAGVSTPIGRFIIGKNSFYWSDTIGLPHLAPSLDAPGECYRIWDANGLGTFNILNQTPTITKGGLILNSYVLGITRSRNVIRWDSPAFTGTLKGTDFALVYTKNATGAEQWYPGADTPSTALGYARNYEDGQTVYGRVRYNGKGISLHASVLDQKIQGGTYTAAFYNGPLDTKAFRLGGSYKFPFGLKAGIVFDSTTISNGVGGGNATFGATVGDAKRTAWEIPVSYTWGDHMFHVTYGKAGDVSDARDSGADQLNLVWDYALTKRAFIGLYYTQLKNGKNGHYQPFLSDYSFGSSAPNLAGINGESWRQIGLNVQFWF